MRFKIESNKYLVDSWNMNRGYAVDEKKQYMDFSSYSFDSYRTFYSSVYTGKYTGWDRAGNRYDRSIRKLKKIFRKTTISVDS